AHPAIARTLGLQTGLAREARFFRWLAGSGAARQGRAQGRGGAYAVLRSAGPAVARAARFVN
ncbi:hypothetical protein, partial [Hydrogenophaga sp. 70-12]|uniref:hypothetical protein n=1 Tax=Hydrogenophaga sp. 70-12 TaxID=1895769 RepID=UPI00257F1AB6